MAEAAEKLEQGEWLSTSEIAKRCGIDRVTCGKRLEDLGQTPDEERSGPKNKVYWFNDQLKFEIKAAKDTVAAMKIRETRARAEKLEMQNALTRRELVPMAEAVELAQRLVSSLYQEYTVRLPKRVGNQLAKAKNVQAVKQILKRDGDKIMQSVRTNFPEFIKQ